MKLITDYSYQWRPDSSPDACVRVARKTGGDNFSWNFARVDSITLYDGTKWVEWKASAGISTVQPNAAPWYRIAWVRRNSPNTTTFGSYGAMVTRILMMGLGMHDCRMSLIDEQTGTATITGYTYSRVDASGVHDFVVPEDSLSMEYVIGCNYPIVDPLTVGSEKNQESPALSLAPVANPAGPPIRLNLVVRRPGAVRVEIFGVAGRRMRVIDLGQLQPGTYMSNWDGTDAGGHRVASGVYWIQARLGGVSQTQRLVLLK